MDEMVLPSGRLMRIKQLSIPRIILESCTKHYVILEYRIIDQLADLYGLLRLQC